MKKYRIEASSVEFYYLIVEAENEDQAWQIADKAQGGDFKSYALGDWQIDSLLEEKDEEKENAY